MKDILQEIIAAKRIAVEQLKRTADRSALERKIDENRSHRSMREALAASTSGIIAEFKRRSPSKGWINREADVRTVASDYQANGAAALSILTDTPYFGGSAEDLIAARPQIDIPILRKDFTIDEFQLYESRAIGADAVLLIAAALPLARCRELAATAHRLGLEVLLEIHSEKELDYISDEVDMIGVNNRNLGTFSRRELVPAGRTATARPAVGVRKRNFGSGNREETARSGFPGLPDRREFHENCRPRIRTRHIY